MKHRKIACTDTFVRGRCCSTRSRNNKKHVSRNGLMICSWMNYFQHHGTWFISCPTTWDQGTGVFLSIVDPPHRRHRIGVNEDHGFRTRNKSRLRWQNLNSFKSIYSKYFSMMKRLCLCVTRLGRTSSPCQSQVSIQKSFKVMLCACIMSLVECRLLSLAERREEGLQSSAPAVIPSPGVQRGSKDVKV